MIKEALRNAHHVTGQCLLYLSQYIKIYLKQNGRVNVAKLFLNTKTYKLAYLQWVNDDEKA